MDKLLNKKSILIIIVIAGILIAFFYFSSTDEEFIEDTYTVTYGEISQRISGDGTVRQSRIENITPLVSGKVIATYIGEGTYVNEGDLLYELDASSINYEIQKAQIAYDKAKYLYEHSSEEEKYLNSLELKSSEVELNNLKNQRENYNVRSPMSGSIIKVNFTTGNYYDSSSGPIAIVANQSSYITTFSVDEIYIDQISYGQAATVSINALESANDFEGIVTYIDLMGNNNNGVITYNVTVSFEDLENSGIFNGMATNINILLSQKDDILVIPTSSVSHEGTVTLVSEDSELIQIPVELGIANDNFVEVISGLEPGDIILKNIQYDQEN